MADKYSWSSPYSTVSVEDKTHRPVAARYLTDSQGHFVMNPNTPGVPYIAPLDYYPQGVISAYRNSWNRAFSNAAALVSQSDDNALPVVLGAARGQVYRDLTREFSTGGPQDLQRTYNGTAGNTFVPAFTDVTAMNLGLAAGAGKITGTEAVAGGGLLNLYKGIIKGEPVTLGPIFGLRPESYANIMDGVRLHREGAFDNSGATPQSNIASGSLNDYDASENPGYAFERATIPGAANPAVGPSADSNALNAFLPSQRYGSRNALNF